MKRPINAEKFSIRAIKSQIINNKKKEKNKLFLCVVLICSERSEHSSDSFKIILKL